MYTSDLILCITVSFDATAKLARRGLGESCRKQAVLPITVIYASGSHHSSCNTQSFGWLALVGIGVFLY
eukprot:scaffold314875_cov25-Prasinocladus_malaysianus.AAC.1